jgi:hypothetical protein
MWYFLPWATISTPLSTNRSTWRESERRVASGEVHWTSRSFCYCTIKNCFSRSDRAFCSMICFKFYVVTWPALCIKVVALQTSYKSTIETWLIYPLLWAWIESKVEQISLLVKIQSIRVTDSNTLSPFNSNFCTTLVSDDLNKVILL